MDLSQTLVQVTNKKIEIDVTAVNHYTNKIEEQNHPADSHSKLENEMS